MMISKRHRFVDRIDAARQLAIALGHYRGWHPLVLAIPRGGVPIGRVVADALDGELDVVLVRKLGAPYNPELAIGAVDENGNAHLAEYAHRVRADADYVARETERQREVIRERRRRYSPQRPPIDPAGRVVIVVDDGLATGATMRAALSAIRARHPQRLVCAVPVAAPDSLDDVTSLADEVVCLDSPGNFQAVGQFYDEFLPVDDEDVVALLSSGTTATVVAAARTVHVPVDGIQLEGDLDIPANACGLVIFAHGSGSSRKSPRNRLVARELNHTGLATLLFDLLTEREDRDRGMRFDVALLAERLGAALAWARRDAAVGALPVGLFGASTGAAAALAVAAHRPDIVKAVVSRGGRPDLADGTLLARVVAPTLLIVGGADTDVLALNETALSQMPDSAQLMVVPGATHLFEEPGALEDVAVLAAQWFERWLVHAPSAQKVATHPH